MANDLTGNPLVVDTAAVLTTDPKRLQKMRWHPNDANNDCVVQHADGSALWPIRSITTSANNESAGIEEIDFNPAFPARGIKVASLTGGKLYIYLYTVI
jgi:hypothetical protein